MAEYKGNFMNIKLKPSFKIVAYYMSFGFLWIMFSDKFIGLITTNINQYSLFQTYKGLFFVLFTSFLLFKMIGSYLEKEKYDKETILEKDFKLDQINNNMNHLFDISIKMLSPLEYCDEYFIKEIFRIASNISEENDLGSAYIVKNGEIKFIDSIGFDLKELEKMKKDVTLYKISPEKIIVNRDCKKEVEKKLKNKESPLKNIKESIYVGIYKDKKVIGGFNLDISEDSNKTYSNEILNRIQVIQDISNGFYRIKKYSDYKLILQNDIVRSFITALEFHDDYTKGHSDLVAVYSIKIGKALGLDKKQMEDLYWSAIMHDIGKIIIPVQVLNKTQKLSNSEFDLIKKHSKIGYEIISKSKTLNNISEYVLFHHERWDGMGYPNGLKGDKIPLLSQIICVADCWHAMTSERPYKNKLTIEDGIEELIRNRGTQFSPEIVDVFIGEKLYLVDEKFMNNKIEFKDI
jgi:HD-GYP domain-containing protein (c-di-GMP phosphodiesterase class II)